MRTLVALALLAGPCVAFSQEPPMRPRPDQQVILITGSTDGLGREVALRLAAEGAHVIVHGRNRERGEAVVQQIAAGGRGSAAFFPADFASLDSARAFANRILDAYSRIDVLVNNAGIWLTRGERQLSEEGQEMHFAVNYLAGYLLTHLLLDRIIESAPSRIVNVASAAQQPIDLDDITMERRYNGTSAYARSKLAQVMFTFDLADRLAGRNVIVVALHPATLMDTPMVREAGVRPRSTVEEGADALMRLITGDDVVSGAYYDGLEQSRAHAFAYDVRARERLRALSDEIVGR